MHFGRTEAQGSLFFCRFFRRYLTNYPSNNACLSGQLIDTCQQHFSFPLHCAWTRCHRLYRSCANDAFHHLATPTIYWRHLRAVDRQGNYRILFRCTACVVSHGRFSYSFRLLILLLARVLGDGFAVNCTPSPGSATSGTLAVSLSSHHEKCSEFYRLT